jgi:acylpyruvate hydrolase
VRLVSALKGGRPFAGVLEDDEVIPLAGLVELGRETTSAALASAERLESGRMALADVTLRAVVPRPGKIICVGHNYREHLEETGGDDRGYPPLFTKFTSALTGPYDDIALPPESSELDYEGEVAVVIGTAGRRIPRERALDHVAGFSIANDVSMRDYQRKTSQWLQGKAWERSTPLGPVLVTPDEVDATDLEIELTLNGETMQHSNTSHLIFDIADLISTLSEFTSLEPGDVILSGTPGGVGFTRTPPVYLHDGDVVAVAVQGIGRIENRVVREHQA